MSFGAGAAIFNSCNKAGSIVEFTKYLGNNPNDYNALMWRANAYGIVGQPQNELRDIERAISVSSGVQKEIAEGRKVLLTKGLEEYGICANRTIQRYPNEWTAWNQLGSYNSMKGDEEMASRCWQNCLDVATKNNETRDPQICWVNYYLGNYLLKKGDIGSAKGYYEAAVASSPTHTVSHIKLCQCHICQGRLREAREHFQTARELNPGLSASVFQSENFEAYYGEFKLNASSGRPSSSASGLGSAGRYASGRTGSAAGGGSGSGGGGGNGSDDDDDDVSAVWKKLQHESKCIKMYRNHKYVQSKCGRYWYSRDTARHGGAQFKRYDDTGSALRFKDSVDAKLRPLTSKHESREGTIIKKCDMIGVKGH